MTRLKVSDLPGDLAEAMARVAEEDERVLIECGKAQVALVSVRDLDLLERLVETLEDRTDNEAADRALAEPGEDIPWEVVKKKAGLL